MLSNFIPLWQRLSVFNYRNHIIINSAFEISVQVFNDLDLRRRKSLMLMINKYHCGWEFAVNVIYSVLMGCRETEEDRRDNKLQKLSVNQVKHRQWWKKDDSLDERKRWNRGRLMKLSFSALLLLTRRLVFHIVACRIPEIV